MTRIRKWGNSLAVRIPSTYASEARIEENRLVDLILVDGKLVLTPVEEEVPSLAELLGGITPKNLHGEVSTGCAVGREVW